MIDDELIQQKIVALNSSYSEAVALVVADYRGSYEAEGCLVNTYIEYELFSSGLLEDMSYCYQPSMLCCFYLRFICLPYDDADFLSYIKHYIMPGVQ